MTLYSVYARDGDMPAVVPDRFSWLAFLLPPAYALVHGLWLLLVGYVVALAVLIGLGFWIGGGAGFWLYVLMAMLLGFEAPTFRRRQLARRRWGYRGEAVAADAVLALAEVVRRRP